MMTTKPKDIGTSIRRRFVLVPPRSEMHNGVMRRVEDDEG